MNNWQMLHELNSLLAIEKKNKRMRSQVAKAFKASLKVVRRALTIQDYEVRLEAEDKPNATIKGLMEAGYSEKMAYTLATRYSAKRAKEVKEFQDMRKALIVEVI